MTYSVYQHWDPLKSCLVGQTYPPEIYDYIKNEKVRKVFYRIAEETEEDYQKLITLLQKFNVEIIRPDLTPIIEDAKNSIKNNTPIKKPWFMQPRDCTIMLGSDFYSVYTDALNPLHEYLKAKGNTINHRHELLLGTLKIIDQTIVGVPEFDLTINGAMTTRVGKDLYIGTQPNTFSFKESENIKKMFEERLGNYRVHVVDTDGHTDGTFCPVVPGLIFCLHQPINYTETFPEWEIIHLQFESWWKVGDFLKLKKVNNGKWWVPGEELNTDFVDYVETWMNHWVGYVEESVFDVNMLVIDKKNVVVNGYNKLVFDAFDRYGITPHVCNFRHRYFWDGGLHCITSDLHREGVMEDYFPERNLIG